MKFNRFVEQTKKQSQYWSETRTKKIKQARKGEKAPKIEGINLQKKNINGQCNNAREHSNRTF